MTALIFILTTLSQLVITVFVLRILLPVCRVDMRNPLSVAVLRLTNPVILPLRRVLPAVGRLDTATWLTVFVLQLASNLLLGALHATNLPSATALIITCLRDLASLLLQLYLYALLLYAVLSWVAPYDHSPSASVLRSLCSPILKPFQRIIPRIAGLDLSVLFALIAIQALQILLHTQ